MPLNPSHQLDATSSAAATARPTAQPAMAAKALRSTAPEMANTAPSITRQKRPVVGSGDQPPASSGTRPTSITTAAAAITASTRSPTRPPATISVAASTSIATSDQRYRSAGFSSFASAVPSPTETCTSIPGRSTRLPDGFGPSSTREASTSPARGPNSG